MTYALVWTPVVRPKLTWLRMSSIACWSWDARAMSALCDPERRVTTATHLIHAHAGGRGMADDGSCPCLKGEKEGRTLGGHGLRICIRDWSGVRNFLPGDFSVFGHTLHYLGWRDQDHQPVFEPHPPRLFRADTLGNPATHRR